ncbi:MAG: hypothetical protein QOK31_373 [Solirubrobacteraceae bacterium]|jgi:LysM repeat protein|nr:hypothetical protein [Solirubrobacteraceae bacterium]
METSRSRTPLRILAPLALIAFAIALVLVISSAGHSGGSGTSSNAAAKQHDLGTTTKASRHSRRSRASNKLPQSVYIVKANDTLGGIAQTTGVPVARLQELNPGIDQFSLVAGQRIKLR